jgi:glycine dehydrogenase
MVIELTGMEIANASYLTKVQQQLKQCLLFDVRTRDQKKTHVCKFFVSEELPQTYCFTNTFCSNWCRIIETTKNLIFK